jgi:hypothetical protein
VSIRSGSREKQNVWLFPASALPTNNHSDAFYLGRHEAKLLTYNCGQLTAVKSVDTLTGSNCNNRNNVGIPIF